MTNIKSLEALADPTRRMLFERLSEGPCSVGELTEVVSVSQPAVSQHLRVLKEAHLVRVRKAGTRRIYSLDPTGLAELRQYLDELWDDVLTAFQEAAEQEQKEINHPGASSPPGIPDERTRRLRKSKSCSRPRAQEPGSS
jgi:DNA-binding transcriptional ArsR family regulator